MQPPGGAATDPAAGPEWFKKGSRDLRNCGAELNRAEKWQAYSRLITTRIGTKRRRRTLQYGEAKMIQAVPETGARALAANDDAEPFQLPAKFCVAGEAETLHVHLDRDRALIRRVSPEGTDTAVVPMAAYQGVAVSASYDEASGAVFKVTLCHPDPSLSVPLAAGSCTTTVGTAWRSWASALDRPLLVLDPDGSVSARLDRMGAVFAEKPLPRRTGSPLIGRRSRFARRRAAGRPSGAVHRDEREIIARD